MSICVKCQKEYNPKRVGGRFCSVSCGNSYRQQRQRDEQKRTQAVTEGYAVERPLTEEELLLWSILLVLGADARRLLLDYELGVDKRPADMNKRLHTLLWNCQEKANSPMMKQLTIRYEAQQQAQVRIEAATWGKTNTNIKANNPFKRKY